MSIEGRNSFLFPRRFFVPLQHVLRVFDMDRSMQKLTENSGYECVQETEETLKIRFHGAWVIGEPFPSVESVLKRGESGGKTRRVVFGSDDLSRWDSSFLIFLDKLEKFLQSSGLQVDREGLPEGARRLLKLAAAVPGKETNRGTSRVSFLEKLGKETLRVYKNFTDMMEFIGEICLALARLFRGKARVRLSDVFVFVQECGAEALPIVTLISVLVGLILAFVGAIQLKLFGAQIYVANLVVLAMAREMGAMMTGIIMAGRTGAAFAAQLGTMQVNEEIDAFRTLGVPPTEFLVLPRMLALMLMMPLLCVYANFMGIFGGTAVGVFMLDLPLIQYFNQTKDAVTLTDFSIGIFKSVIFGALVALAGCFQGMRCGRSSAAVGLAATAAVVSGIVFIVVSDSIVTVITSILGI